MSKKLVIVESPAKAKTIEKYLGKDYTVRSSVGHIRSIVKKTKDGTPPIDIKNGYKTTYEIDSEKKKVVSELKKLAKEAEEIILATDPDREGEAIAWHLSEVLKLDPKTTKRVTYQEISRDAITKAFANPRTIDQNLVAAQQARQILDRIVGFELSPVVWQKVPGGKSAGRVQSPAVRLLVEREREISEFQESFSFKVTANFSKDSDTFKAELSDKLQTEPEAASFLSSLADKSFLVESTEKTPGVRNPSAPFTTSTLQQDANNKLGFSSKATMASAQRLYQEGKITYMRTDSTSLSAQARGTIGHYIEKTFGLEYATERAYATKNKNAQEAHEAIRPTDISLEKVTSDEYDQKLYNLIRNRTLASQMSPAKIEKTIIKINIPDEKLHFEAKGEIIIFDGFLKVYGSKQEDTILPAVSSGDQLKLEAAGAKQQFSRPPSRYTEGSLVKKLEDLGIGRPSTYATIINTVQERGYAIKGDSEGKPRDIINLELQPPSPDVKREIQTEKTGSDKGKLVPTPSGELISDFLTNHFEQIVDYGFTARVEEEFDEIASAQLERNKMLDEFYEPFSKTIAASADIDRSTTSKSRVVGIDPKSQKPIIARFGRFGPMLQRGETEDKTSKPDFAPMPKETTIDNVTLEQALIMFQLPRSLGEDKDGNEIKANIGRFGPYIQVGKKYLSIKPLDPHTISLEEALEVIKQKAEEAKNKIIAEFPGGISILKGFYGPYITDGKKNAPVPKTKAPEELSEAEATEILVNYTPKPRRGKASAKRTAKKK